MSEDYYRILGVSPFATAEDIKSAFRRLALEYHPDVNRTDPGAEEKFKQINEAYQVLSNLEARKQYDRSRIQRAAPIHRDGTIHFAWSARRYHKSQTLAEVGFQTVAAGIKNRSAGLTLLGVGEIFFDWWLKSKKG